MGYTIEIQMPRHWQWKPFLVSSKIEREAEFRRLFRHTHAPTIHLPALRATIYWPRPLHLPIRWLYGAYIWWARRFIWPFAEHVIADGQELWPWLWWPIDLMERYGDPPTLRQIRDEN